jgi:nucleoside-diphosphate-sugar epimerase
MQDSSFIIPPDQPILVTGAAGFIGGRVLENLLQRGFCSIRCLVRSAANPVSWQRLMENTGYGSKLEMVTGDLLSREDCDAVTKDVSLIYHLAAGTGTKSFADAFMNSVVTTRNLLDAAVRHGVLRRFVGVSSFAVYAGRRNPEARVLDEACPTEDRPELRGDAYCFAKVKQEALIADYGRRLGLPYVLVRPGVVYGPGKSRIHGRVGLGTFGIFLHLGGGNPLPLTFVDNCADAIVLAGLTAGIEGEALNVVDDALPSSRQFLRLYKRHVRRFHSVYIPHFASYLLCWMWEAYSRWSGGQLPPVHNRREWAAYWKRTMYSNEKIKRLLRWSPKVSTSEGLEAYFASCREGGAHA